MTQVLQITPNDAVKGQRFVLVLQKINPFLAIKVPMKALKVCSSQSFVDRIQLLALQSSPHVWLALVVALETRTSRFV